MRREPTTPREQSKQHPHLRRSSSQILDLRRARTPRAESQSPVSRYSFQGESASAQNIDRSVHFFGAVATDDAGTVQKLLKADAKLLSARDRRGKKHRLLPQMILHLK